MIPQLSFGVFHVVQNELIGLKSFNHSIDRLKAFHDKPRPLFGSQENTEVNENIHSQVISFASKKPKKKKNTLSNVNFKWHFSVFPNHRW